jgi:ABC-type uncharacterized transport system substrate-binding protein
MRKCSFVKILHDNTRRWGRTAIFLIVGLMSIAAPTGALSGDAKKPIHIGVVSFAEPQLRTDLDQSLLRGLREQGYIEGINLTIEWRYADGNRVRVPQIATDLAQRKLDAIVTTCTPTTRAMATAAPKMPIVMAGVSDPVGQGLIASYRRPGGKITGTATQFEEMAAKLLQLLHEMVPNAASIGVVSNPNNPVHKIFLRDMASAAGLMGLKLANFSVAQPDHIDTAFDAMRSAGANALMVLPDDSFLFNLRRRIIDKANDAKLPSMFGLREAIVDGGLMSYGESLGQSHFRAAHFVDHIVTGTEPSDLPVEQPTKFELVINLKTAKTLGLAIPPTLLARADSVIE